MIASKLNTNPPLKDLFILHLEDSTPDHHLVCRALDKAQIFYQIHCVDSLSDFTEAVSRLPIDVILADYRLNGFTAIEAWKTVGRGVTSPPFILVSGAIGEELAVQAVQGGISDFVSKTGLVRLPLAIDRALVTRQAQMDRELATQALADSQRKLAEFASHLQATIEAERASIAREIHDDIGGSLVAARLDLAWVSRHADDTAIQSHLESAHSMVQHAMGASQRIMMNLRPAVLDQGLIAAVQWLTEGFRKRTGISVSLTAHANIPLKNKTIELVAYRVAQEALTNASKHASCKNVRVDISDAEGVLTLEISDDGVGVSTEDQRKPKAFGLRGLQERAQTVGGWLDISSIEGKGTTIILSVPLGTSTGTPTWDSES
jgi:signal transduction histidine kinase